MDASNYSKMFTLQGIQDLKNAGVVGVIIQAVTGLDGNSYTRQQLSMCVDNGLRIAGYVFPGYLATKLDMFQGFDIEFLILDVELPISIDDVNASLAICDQYMAAHGRPRLTSIYSGRWFFANMGWLGYTQWADEGRALWDSNYDDTPMTRSDFRPYGGWAFPAVKQYHGTTDVGHIHTVDLDVIGT